MKEKNIQSLFSVYIKNNPPDSSMVWELKLEKGTSMLFSKVKDHQIKALLEAEKIGLYHKIADQTIGRGNTYGFTLKKPCDCLFVRGEAYVVIVFYTPRKPKIALWIRIKAFVDEIKSSDRKSLTEKRAIEIAEKSCQLKTMKKK